MTYVKFPHDEAEDFLRIMNIAAGRDGDWEEATSTCLAIAEGIVADSAPLDDSAPSKWRGGLAGVKTVPSDWGNSSGPWGAEVSIVGAGGGHSGAMFLTHEQAVELKEFLLRMEARNG